MTAIQQSTDESRPMEVSDFDWSHVDIARQAMVSMLDQIKTHESQYDVTPLPDSQASREMSLVPQVEKAYDRAGTLMMNAFDHAYALDTLLARRNHVFAPWTCSRVILEACALASWLLDEEIVCRQRVLRCTKLRLKDIRDQRLHYENNLDRIRMSALAPDFEQEQDDLRRELSRLLEMACELALPIEEMDFEPSRFANLGGSVKPTEIVSQYFGDYSESYQTLSGVAHGNEWAMYNYGMRLVRQGAMEVMPALVPFRVMHLVIKGTRWIGDTTLRKFNLLGMDTDTLSSILEIHRPEAWVSSAMSTSRE